MADGSSSQSEALLDKKLEDMFNNSVQLYKVGKVAEAANEFRKVGYSFKQPFKMKQF